MKGFTENKAEVFSSGLSYDVSGGRKVYSEYQEAIQRNLN